MERITSRDQFSKMLKILSLLAKADGDSLNAAAIGTQSGFSLKTIYRMFDLIGGTDLFTNTIYDAVDTAYASRPSTNDDEEEDNERYKKLWRRLLIISFLRHNPLGYSPSGLLEKKEYRDRKGNIQTARRDLAFLKSTGIADLDTDSRKYKLNKNHPLIQYLA